MASRRKGRILAFQALYSWEIHHCLGTLSPKKKIPEELLDFSWTDSKASLNEETRTFSRLLVTGTIENIKTIDKKIQEHLVNWEITRLNRVDLAILRISIYTLMFQSDIHPSIVIDEAIGISKEFGSDDSYRFINGVLDNVKKTLV